MRVFHRTTPEAAELIWRTGRFVSREAGEPVFVSNRLAGQADGYGGAVVRLDIPRASLTLDDEFPDGERHFRVAASDIRAEWIVQRA